MPKIAMIGAGSLVFCETLVMDILATESLRESEIRLMSRTKPKLDRMASFVKRVIRENHLPANVKSTLNRREALDGADYVIVMIQVGGIKAFGLDIEIPKSYGVDQCIGDSMGPGGIFRGLRTIPVLADIVREMRQVCPNAILINYANPMAANCLALGRISPVPFIGLCHGVQTTLDLISRYVGVPKHEIDHLCAGINHMAWFLSLKDARNGRDLYPVLRRQIEKPGYYVNEKVRCEVMRHFGYFMTESTGHLSEYLPWFRSSARALRLYCDQPGFGGEYAAYYKFCQSIGKTYQTANYLQTEPAALRKRSVEYCSYILEAMETGNPFKLNGNVRNDGYISNLPNGCCVEVPVYVDRRGLHPLRVGALPVQCAALNRSNVTVQELAAEAALTGNPELAMQAVAMDPVAASVCTLHEIRDMTSKMLKAEKEWLPQFKGKTVRPVPVIKMPKGAKGVDVPVDPALAIANRFAKLAGN